MKRLLPWFAVPAAAAALWFGSGTARSSGDQAGPEPHIEARAQHRFIDEVVLDGLLRGNVHVHTRVSDGDSSPQKVIAWYVNHGYDFVAITDHNRRLDPERYQAGVPEGFVLVPGEEVTMAATGKPVHVNGLCTTDTIGEARFARRDDALRWAIERILDQGGIAMVNHPNFIWALQGEHVVTAAGAHMLDIFNGHPHVNSDGDDKHASVEALWQSLLDIGIDMAPAAVDDAHAFTADPPKGVPNAVPGTGWIEVAAGARDASSICEAMEQGRVVASNGPRITRVVVAERELGVWIADGGATIEFIGRGGEVLASERPSRDGESFVASYELRGAESLVRARVVAADGTRAWTPAYRAMTR